MKHEVEHGKSKRVFERSSEVFDRDACDKRREKMKREPPQLITEMKRHKDWGQTSLLGRNKRSFMSFTSSGETLRRRGRREEEEKERR